MTVEGKETKREARLSRAQSISDGRWGVEKGARSENYDEGFSSPALVRGGMHGRWNRATFLNGTAPELRGVNPSHQGVVTASNRGPTCESLLATVISSLSHYK